MRAIGQKVHTGRWHLLRLCLVLVMSIVALGSSSGVSRALPDDSDPLDPPLPQGCTPFAHVGLTSAGLPLVGWDVLISAADAKLVDLCSGVYSLPPGGFNWTLQSQPPGSTATLNDWFTLTPSLRPDIAGEYLVTFTACPGGGCDFTLASGEPAHVDPTSWDLTITAEYSVTVPAGTDPVLPPLIITEPSDIPDIVRWFKCSGGGGVIDPQWVTVEPWGGVNDYVLLEGKVWRSRLSTIDNELNHHSQDHLVHVLPDADSRWLLMQEPQWSNRPDLLGVEWEGAEFPEAFRPTSGDRVSVYGFWIHDCGHSPFYTEIHPPVGMAVHRSRPVQIPSDFTPDGFPDGLGTNVYVPGIVTDIWFNRDAGEITSNCSDSGLGQPYSGGGIIATAGGCIQGPNPINRSFTFNIYLPPNPQDTLAEILETPVTAPLVPLYISYGSHPAYGSTTGPDPDIGVKWKDGVIYLEVTIDLSSFTGDTYQRRIEAAWAYPDANNWGLRSWKLRVISLTDIDDSDWIPWNDGDWRLWVNTNNTDMEWTNVLWCNGCVHDTMTFSGIPWETGGTSTHDLGPDILLFPSQRIWVHSGGWDEDWLLDDSTGFVNDSLPQEAHYYHSQSQGGGGSYVLNYEILAMDRTGLVADLTPEAEYLHEGYVISAGDQLMCLTMTDICVLVPELTGYLPEEWNPMNWIMEQQFFEEQQFIELVTTRLFKPQPVETFALTNISIEDLAEVISVGVRDQPEAIDRTLRQLRDAADAVLKSGLAAEAILDLRSLKEAFPKNLWEKYFGGIVFATDGVVRREASDSNPEPGQVVTISIKPEDFSVPYAVQEELSQGLEYTGAHTADGNPTDTVFTMLAAKGFSYKVRIPEDAELGKTFTIRGKYWDYPDATVPVEATVLTVTGGGKPGGCGIGTLFSVDAGLAGLVVLGLVIYRKRKAAGTRTLGA